MSELRAPARQPCPTCGVALIRVPGDGCSIVYRCHHCKTDLVKRIPPPSRAPARSGSTRHHPLSRMEHSGTAAAGTPSKRRKRIAKRLRGYPEHACKRLIHFQDEKQGTRDG